MKHGESKNRKVRWKQSRKHTPLLLPQVNDYGGLGSGLKNKFWVILPPATPKGGVKRKQKHKITQELGKEGGMRKEDEAKEVQGNQRRGERKTAKWRV